MLGHSLAYNLPDFQIKLIPVSNDQWPSFTTKMHKEKYWSIRHSRDRTIKKVQLEQLIWYDTGELIGQASIIQAMPRTFTSGLKLLMGRKLNLSSLSCSE